MLSLLARLAREEKQDVAGRGRKTIHFATERNLPKLITFIFEQHGRAVLNAPDKLGFRPIHYAAQYGYNDALVALVEAGADRDANSSAGFNSIHFCAGWGRIECVRYLVNMKADVNHASSAGFVALHSACELLLSANAKVDTADPNLDRPLHYACQEGNPEVVKVLLVSKADINAPDKTGSTPCHLAAQEGHLAVLRVLATNGATMNALTNSGEQPFSLAYNNNHFEVSRWLQITDSWPRLHYLAEERNLDGVLDELRSDRRGASCLGPQGPEGWTAMQAAAGVGGTNTELLPLALEVDSDVTSILALAAQPFSTRSYVLFPNRFRSVVHTLLLISRFAHSHQAPSSFKTNMGPPKSVDNSASHKQCNALSSPRLHHSRESVSRSPHQPPGRQHVLPLRLPSLPKAIVLHILSFASVDWFACKPEQHPERHPHAQAQKSQLLSTVSRISRIWPWHRSPNEGIR